MNFERLSEFEKDLKKLTKKYQTLPDDLRVIQQVLTTWSIATGFISSRLS